MRIFGIAALAALLTGCASSPPPPQTAAFNPSEAQFARAKGTATVKGQSFLRRNDGVVVPGAGSEVVLLPRTPYTEEAMQIGFNGRKLRMEVKLFGANVLGNDYKLVPEIEPYLRRNKADGQGNFIFEGVPPGNYYILSRVTWCVPSRYSCDQQGGDLLETVTIAPSDRVLTAMLNGA